MSAQLSLEEDTSCVCLGLAKPENGLLRGNRDTHVRKQERLVIWLLSLDNKAGYIRSIYQFLSSVGNGRIIERRGRKKKVVRKRSGLEICCLSGPVPSQRKANKKKSLETENRYAPCVLRAASPILSWYLARTARCGAPACSIVVAGLIQIRDSAISNPLPHAKKVRTGPFQ